MILLLLLIPFIVGIGFQILGQRISILVSKIECGRLLLTHVHPAGRSFNLHVAFEYRHRGIGIAQLNTKVSRFGE